MATRRPETGQEIDGFTLLQPIHQGPMSSLWKARQGDDPAPLVLKIPAIAEGDDVSSIVGFEVEQMILPRLSGPHVPRFVAAGDFSRTPYIAMELVQGESLAARSKGGRLPVDEAVDIAIRVSRALHDLHRQHVIHLDLKPANLMLREGGEAVFLDFGLSRHDELPDLLGEESDVPMGTAPYIAPEQIFGERGEPLSDIFALGVMLYEFVTGEWPFGNPRHKAGMTRRLWRDPVPPRALAPDCPPWLQEVILRCLEVDPARRYGSASQLCFALQNPGQVALTERASRLAQDGFFTVLKRRMRAGRPPRRPQQLVAERLAEAPIVMAAVDLAGGVTPLAEAQRIHVKRALDAAPGAKLACVTVLKTALLSLEAEAEGNDTYVQRLVELKDWARPIAPGDGKVSFHVLEALDPAAALIEYAQKNEVDEIVVGARASSALRRYLGSVSAKIVAEAGCTVTVVRVPEPAAAE
jgi:nucleotide-binding universal stress UspA family protein